MCNKQLRQAALIATDCVNIFFVNVIYGHIVRKCAGLKETSTADRTDLSIVRVEPGIWLVKQASFYCNLDI